MRVDATRLRRLFHVGHGEVADAHGAHLALLARQLQVLHSGAHILAAPRPMDIVEVYHVGAKALKAGVDLVEHGAAFIAVYGGLGGEEDAVAAALQELADQLLGLAAAVAAGRVEVIDA